MTRMPRTAGFALVAALAAGPAAAAQQPVRPAVPAPAAQSVPPAKSDAQPPSQFVSDDDAERTRERLRAIFRQYPPSLADVLKLDPSLLVSDAYLAPYPELAAFLKQHPNTAHSPGYFVGTARTEWNQAAYAPGRDALRVVDSIFTELFVLTGILTFMALIGWSIKKLVDHRRWLRMSKTQTEAHAKVFDRMSSNEDLLAYVQSPAGQKFLESAPIAVDERSLGAPIGRILFAAQAGTIITFVGVALSFASSRLSNAVPDFYQAAPFFFTASVLMVALGVGFIASAGVAYFLSRRLGLLEAHSPHA
jgi:hypothetical protein